MLELDSLDQAAGLRRMIDHKPVQVFAVTSGKGGVGKSSMSINVATAMAAQGRNVMLLDGDLGLANLDVLLNLNPRYHLGHVVNGERTLDEVIVKGPLGVSIVPAASGVQRLAELGTAQNVGLIRAFSELTHPVDTLIIDTAAGISDMVISFSKAAREVIIVVCDEPASITDAYATIKVLSKEHGVERFHVLSNKAQSVVHGRELFNKLSSVCERFLNIPVHYLGTVPDDEHVLTSARQQRPVVEAFPRSKAAVALKSIARKLDTLPRPKDARGDMEFFVERLIQFSVTNGMSLV